MNAMSVNELIDGVLEDAKESLANNEDEATLPLPDAEDSFETRVGPIRVKGKWRTEGGQFGNLASLRRTGDSVVTISPDGVTLKLELGLQEAYVRLPRYWVEVGRAVRAKGKIDVKVQRNSVSASVTIRQAGNGMKATVDFVSIDVLEGFDVSLTGLGIVNHMAAKIVEWLAKEFNRDIKRRIGDALSDNFQRSLNKTDLTHVLANIIR